MSERGVFAVDRGVFDHPLFAAEPFTEREAWIWLIGEAAWKPRHRRLGDTVFSLERGQLVVSLRFLAERWGWSKAKVERFLDRLRSGRSTRGGRPKKQNPEKPPCKSETLIETATETGYTVITICNYSRYQRVSLPTETATETENETRTRHQRDKLEDNKNIEEDIIGEPRAAAFSEESKRLARAFCRALGIHSPQDIPTRYAGVYSEARRWERAGWTEDIITLGVQLAGPDKPFAYYEKVFATTFAKQNAPLPVVELKSADKITVNSNVLPKTQSLSQAAFRLAEQGFSLGPKPTLPGLRAIQGGADVRMLPKGGGE